jgi:ribosome biogenesis GTPase
VALENKNRYVLLTTEGYYSGEVTGKLQFTAQSSADLPKVGDWVLITVFEQEQKAIIHTILKRKTCFSRKVAGSKQEEQIIAVNIDLIFIVQAPDATFNLRRLERYLVMAHESGAQPVIILNKTDLCTDVLSKVQQLEETAGSVPVVALSCLNEPVEAILAPYLQPGTTIAFTGTSGVGKSTLINKLAGQERQITGIVRTTDSKGRHNTTHRELMLWQAEEGLDETFNDFSVLITRCHFGDCSHTREKGCAVLQSVEAGETSMERYKSFMKLQREHNYLLLTTDKNKFLSHKKSVKSLHKQIKKQYRNKQ